jgi:hypothetical protein
MKAAINTSLLKRMTEKSKRKQVTLAEIDQELDSVISQDISM